MSASILQRIGFGTPATPEPATDGPAIATVFKLLKNDRRRYAVEIVGARQTPIRQRALAEQVAARENGCQAYELKQKERQRVYIPLYQNHLDPLVDAGLLAWDKDGGEIRSGPFTGRALALLEAAQEFFPLEAGP